MNMEHQWNEHKREKLKYGKKKKPVPMLLYPSQIQHGLTMDETLASGVIGYQLTK